MKKNDAVTNYGLDKAKFNPSMSFLAATPESKLEDKSQVWFMFMACGKGKLQDGTDSSNRLIVRYIRSAETSEDKLPEDGWSDALVPVSATMQFVGLNAEEIGEECDKAIDNKTLFHGFLYQEEDRRGNLITTEIGGREIPVTHWIEDISQK